MVLGFGLRAPHVQVTRVSLVAPLPRRGMDHCAASSGVGSLASGAAARESLTASPLALSR
jgi:hypothetical protein